VVVGWWWESGGWVVGWKQRRGVGVVGARLEVVEEVPHGKRQKQQHAEQRVEGSGTSVPCD
jgi:hypothetical protein